MKCNYRSIWILREKELLQEISGMGELGGDWRRKQMDLLDKHLKLLNNYSQAKQNLQQLVKEEGNTLLNSLNQLLFLYWIFIYFQDPSSKDLQLKPMNPWNLFPLIYIYNACGHKMIH